MGSKLIQTVLSVALTLLDKYGRPKRGFSVEESQDQAVRLQQIQDLILSLETTTLVNEARKAQGLQDLMFCQVASQ